MDEDDSGRIAQCDLWVLAQITDVRAEMSYEICDHTALNGPIHLSVQRWIFCYLDSEDGSSSLQITDIGL